VIRDVHAGPFLPLVECVLFETLVDLGQVSERVLRQRAFQQPERLARAAELELARRESLA